MLTKIKFGEVAKQCTINRISCAEGSKARAVFISKDPAVKATAFDQEVRRTVEVDQELMMKYRDLKPRNTYYFLVAKLNTDQKNNISDNSFTVEYLQLSQSQYQEFNDACAEMNHMTSIVIAKEKKTVNGQDMSYIKATPSDYNIPQEILDKIEALKNTDGFIEGTWELVDGATSISKQEYITLKSLASGQAPAQALQVAAPKAAPAIEAPEFKQPAVDVQEINTGFGGFNDADPFSSLSF